MPLSILFLLPDHMPGPSIMPSLVPPFHLTLSATAQIMVRCAEAVEATDGSEEPQDIMEYAQVGERA